MTPVTVAIIGSTGTLGQLLAKHLFALQKQTDSPSFKVRALVRSSSLEKPAAKYLSENGAEIVVGDITEDATIQKLVDGVHTVVCTAQGGPDIIIDAQTKVLEACVAAGVKRFVPTDFSFNFFGLEEGDNINSDWRRAFAQKAEGIKGSVQVVHVLNGCFMDKQVFFGFLGAVSLEESTLYVWGDFDKSTQKINFTSFNDTAAFTAAMAVDVSNRVPDKFCIAGDSLTISEVAKAYENATGRKLAVVTKGSLKDLTAEIEQNQKADPANVFGYLPGMYYRAMLNGNGHYEPTGNTLYPSVVPESFESYIKNNIA